MTSTSLNHRKAPESLQTPASSNVRSYSEDSSIAYTLNSLAHTTSDAATLIISNRNAEPFPSPPLSVPPSERRRSIFGQEIQQAIHDQRRGAGLWESQSPDFFPGISVLERDKLRNGGRQGQSYDALRSESCLYQIDASDVQIDLTPPGSPVSGALAWPRSQEDHERVGHRKKWLQIFSKRARDLSTERKSSRASSHSCKRKEAELRDAFETPASAISYQNGDIDSLRSGVPRKRKPHETRHAQSLLLGLAFCAVWSSSNIMAPNLTEIASTFGWTDAADRDLYLGSYCALATGVFSFPIAAAIGVAVDLTKHRQRLFVATVAGSGLATAGAAAAMSYRQFIAARLVTGGFMAGSVPVAFSFLGDLFSAHERNAASSGLTACMGIGILAGQVYAGSNLGDSWRHVFWVSSYFSLACALLCGCLVSEPIRGGKEAILQDMFQKTGKRYDRKLTWSGFVHSIRHNNSNWILLWQGFFSNLPWGIIFVFLNDFLSQERGFSVPDATFLILVFAAGSGVGGILGGYIGQILHSVKRSYLPLFMAVSTAAGIIPLYGFINGQFTRARSAQGLLLSFASGLIASLPAVSVRPCLLNVNPPETRGATLTAANLLITLGRGVGPSCITLLSVFCGCSRKSAFNITVRSSMCFVAKVVTRECSQLTRSLLDRPFLDDQRRTVTFSDKMAAKRRRCNGSRACFIRSESDFLPVG